MIVMILKAVLLLIILYIFFHLVLFAIGFGSCYLTKVSSCKTTKHTCLDDTFYLGVDDPEPVELNRPTLEITKPPKAIRKTTKK